VWYGSDGQVKAMDEDVVLASCGDQPSLLTLIVFNLIADSRLPQQFTLDQFIELMLSDSIVPTEGKIFEVYRTIYSVKFAHDPVMLDQLNIIVTLFMALSLQLSNEQVHQVGELLSQATHISDQ
jgi:hypothetical protein